MTENNPTKVQDKIQEILDKCSTGNYIFRGENKGHDAVSSRLYRQYCQAGNDNPNSNSRDLIDNKHFSAFNVEKDIVDKVRRHLRSNASNIEVLTELQHCGGKTALLDFTKDIHIALFFACAGNFDEDGRVILYETFDLLEAREIDYTKLYANERENIYTLISPTGKNPRIVFQSSIFVHMSKGYLETNHYDIIKIENDLKKPLLDYLNKHFNIKNETIYNDIQGFLQYQDNHFSAEMEFYSGYVNQQARQFGEAIENYTKAIQLDPQHTTAYCNRAIANATLGRDKEAIQDCDKAVESAPQLPEAYDSRGNVNTFLGKHKKAIQDYDKALEINPQYVAAYSNRGVAKSILGQHQEAIRDYTEALKLNSKISGAYNNRGNANADLYRYQEAIQDYIEAKKLYKKEGRMEKVKKCEKQITEIKNLMANSNGGNH